MSQNQLQELCDLAASFFARGYAFGSTGNLSLREGDSVWITPTGRSFRNLEPADLARIDMDGRALNQHKPSKEYPFHLGCYQQAAGRKAAALVHLHSTYSVALSCLAELDEAKPLPLITPYYLMRVAPLAIVPYFRPGSARLGEAVALAARDHDCLLLRNHGLIALGRTLAEAADRAEELEETAKLAFLLRGESLRELTGDEQAEIWRVYRGSA